MGARGSRAGSFRVLAGPGTTAGRSLVSRASSLASFYLCCDAGRCGKVTKNLGLPCCASARTCLRSPTAAGLGLRFRGISTRVGLLRRWGRHRCRARLGFAVALRVAAAVAVQTLAQRLRQSCSRCDSSTRVVSQQRFMLSSSSYAVVNLIACGGACWLVSNAASSA